MKTTTLSIMIGGAAGSGIKSIESLLAAALKAGGLYLFSTKEYMSRVRGGTNTVQLRLAGHPVAAPTWHCDLYVALDEAALAHAAERFSDQTLIIADKAYCDAFPRRIPLEMKAQAAALGGKQYLNTYAAGVVLGVLNILPEAIETLVTNLFAGREPERNLSAFLAGVAEGKRAKIAIPLPKQDQAAAACRYMDGTTACGFGFLAGGCNFVAAYPMSPSTGVLTFMAERSNEFLVLVEQAEDEIAALNMVLGAWYGGARGLSTTSGGGYALMGETLSLAGMTETPAVIYLAQRPGPATGLPTRTEQGDLNLAIYAGHGDFPRIVLAPGDTDECIVLGQAAFALADRFQIPVTLLSDQYLADSLQLTGEADFEAAKAPALIATEASYRRYALTETGISPRGVPGYGEGLVCCDSDEHDERGQITESYAMRNAMVAKRHRKQNAVLASVPLPEIWGEGSIAVVGWGSTKRVIREVLAQTGDPRLFHVHFSWVFPLSPDTLAALQTACQVIVVENNSNAQFAMQLCRHGIRVDHSVLQSDGFPFFADRLAEHFQSLPKELS